MLQVNGELVEKLNKEEHSLDLFAEPTNQHLPNDIPISSSSNEEIKIENKEDRLSNEPISQTQVLTNISSKLDLASKEDLIRIVKKQLVTINNARKQIDIYKKTAEEKHEKINEFTDKKSTEMIYMELNDYKKSLDTLKNQLKSAQLELEAKDETIKSLSDNIEKLNEEKETYLLSLNQSNSDLNKLKKSLEDKTILITENSKEINLLVVQISQIKEQMQAEIDCLNETNIMQNKKIVEEQQREGVKSREIRKIKNEQEILQQKYDDLVKEYGAFKERAQFVLAQKTTIENESMSAKKSSDEIQDLIDNLDKKREKISYLTEKCAFLEDNLHSIEQNLQTLQIELDSTVESRVKEQNYFKIERQELISEHKIHLRQLEDLNNQLKEEKIILKEENYAEQIKITKNLEEKIKKLFDENKELYEEINRLKNKIRENTEQITSPKKNWTKNKLGLQVKLEENPTQRMSCNLNSNYSNSFDDVYDSNIDEDEENNSDDILSLKSVINQSFNGNLKTSNYSDMTKCLEFPTSIDYQIQVKNLDKQLSHTRDLLADTEETNHKLIEQVRILKNEIRRMERNMERQEHMNNTEYFKNIMLKFLAPEQVSDERHQLLPVLRTMLRLSGDECIQIKKCIENTTKTYDTPTNETENINNSNKDWTGYFGSLSGFF